VNGEPAEKVGSERPMTLLSESMYPKKAPTPKQDQAIREVWAMAQEYAGLPPASRPAFLAEVKKISSGRQRWLATRHTRPDNPHFAPLMALLDALNADRGLVHTKHGGFDQDDLRAAEAKVTREEVAFPVAHPWKIRPDEQTGRPGVRNPAVFRTPAERAAGAKLDTFRVVPRTASSDKEWFDE
jgi:hypothetical protein